MLRINEDTSKLDHYDMHFTKKWFSFLNKETLVIEELNEMRYLINYLHFQN